MVGILSLAESSARRVERRGIDYAQLTRPQRAWVELDDPEAYWIDGNALGKSYAAAWEAIQYLRGRHPTKRRRTPVTGLVIGYSYEQMLPLMEKLWALVPKDELHPSVGFTEGRGFIGKPPRLVLLNGSRIVFATYKAGSKRVAGGQYDFVILDEPPPARILGEARPRVLRKRGWLRVLMTPVPDMPDPKHLKDQIAAGVRRHTVGLEEASCWPEGYPAPWHYQAEIDAYAETLLGPERAMRLRGSLDPVITGRWVGAYLPERHLRAVPLRELRGWTLTLGIDHGTTGRKQVAVLSAAQGGALVGARGERRPRLVYLGEAVSDGFTAPEDDARAIRTLLSRWGLQASDVDRWVGDIPTVSTKRDIVKSNAALRAAIEAEYGYPIRHVETADKGPGSLTAGARTLNTLFSRDDCTVDPSCEELSAAFLQFDGGKYHPLKDVFDAARYSGVTGVGGPLPPALVAHY